MNELELFVALNEQAETVKAEGRKVAVILEGRDSAGKSGTIKTFTRYLPNYTFKVQPSFKPSSSIMRKWLSTWAKKMPCAGQIVFYDRSWYSRALLQPVMGWCSESQYRNFMKTVNNWEAQSNIQFIKFWLSISETEQSNRLGSRETDPLRYWKFSDNDPVALTNFDKLTLFKTQMFDNTFGWNSINYSNKKDGRLEALRVLVSELKG
jgi:polyphosphate kinase 2 (PPK2 family)